MKAKHWYDYLWVYAIIYFALGFFNILFAWLGMIDFLLPLFLAIFGGNKFFCNHLCGRGQLFSKLGTDLKCSRCKPTPRWMSSKWFRYGFLIFFLETKGTAFTSKLLSCDLTKKQPSENFSAFFIKRLAFCIVMCYTIIVALI